MSPNLERLSGIGRPLDPDWTTNRAVLILTPLAGLAGALWVWLGPGTGSAVGAGILAAGAAFGGWALAREVDPDRQGTAFLAMGFAVLQALLVPEASLLLLFTGLMLVRVVNRTVGPPATPLDDLVILGLTAWCVWATANPLVGFVAAAAFSLDARLPDPAGERGPARHWAVAVLALLPALWGSGSGPEGALGGISDILPAPAGIPAPAAPTWAWPSSGGWLAVGVLSVVYLVRLASLRTVDSVCDRTPDRLTVLRVRAGMAVALALALTSVAFGDAGIRQAVLLWAVVAAAGLWRGR